MSKRRSPESREAIEGRILSAALSLGDDLNATSMPTLARKAAIAVGTLYRIAPSKSALAQRLDQIARSRFDQFVFAPFPARLTMTDRFNLFWDRLSGFALSERQIAAYLGVNGFGGDTAFGRASAAFARDGQAAGLFAALSGEQVAALVWGPLATLVRSPSCNAQMLSDLKPCVWRSLTR